MTSAAYKLGQFAGENKTISLLILALSLGSMVSMCSTPSRSSSKQDEVPSVEELCSEKALFERVAKATEAAKSKEYESVILALGICHTKIAEDAEGYKLLTQARSAIEKKQAEEKRQQLVEWKKQGVTIGMSKERVLLSSWGRPETINTTTGRYGTHEQWVYGSRNYLYFQNGTLTSIQN